MPKNFILFDALIDFFLNFASARDRIDRIVHF